MKTKATMCGRITLVVLAILTALSRSTAAYQLGTCGTLPPCVVDCSTTIPYACVKEAKDTGFQLYSSCQTIDDSDGYCRGYELSITSLDIRYTHSPSLVWVPSNSATDLRAVIHDVGQSICLGGESSQPGTYIITGVALDGKSLSVTPAPQTATDQALDVVLTSTSCPNAAAAVSNHTHAKTTTQAQMCSPLFPLPGCSYGCYWPAPDVSLQMCLKAEKDYGYAAPCELFRQAQNGGYCDPAS